MWKEDEEEEEADEDERGGTDPKTRTVLNDVGKASFHAGLK